MEIKFIWINKYKNIIKEGFNFRHSLNQEFDFVKGQLIISESPEVPANFFSSNITGLTAIVGKNGSGKTNLTEFINYCLAHVTNGGLSTYLQLNGLVILNNWILVQNNIEIKNREYLESVGYTVIPFNHAPLDQGNGELRWHQMEQNKYIYYSPAFDLRSIPMRDNFVDISTTALAYNDVYNSKKIYGYAVSNKPEANQLNAFENMEKSRICDFILNFNNSDKYIDFLPIKIRMKIDTSEINFHLLKDYFYSDDLISSDREMFQKLKRELDGLQEYHLWRETFKEFFVRERESSSSAYYKLPISDQKSFFFRLLFLNVFQILLNNRTKFPSEYFRQFLFNLKIENKLENKSIERKLFALKNKIQTLIDSADWNEFEFTLDDDLKENKGSIYWNLGTLAVSIGNNKKLLKEIISLERDLLSGKNTISWETANHQFSSGQKHLLTMYSRFFWAQQQVKDLESGDYGIRGESIVIFIDEGEVALHPEWQRTFINKLVQFLSQLFEQQKIQIILTTHSPFVLSDIPKEYIIFLERDADGFARTPSFEKENTFGANIYSLLSDSFFMQNTIGSFAEKKMRWALEVLRSERTTLNEDEIKMLNYVVDSIGEPMIKEQFQHLLSKKITGEEVSVLKKRIEELQTQIKKIANDNSEN